eukprot:8235423-Pyramimonas_sp.AAC.1
MTMTTARTTMTRTTKTWCNICGACCKPWPAIYSLCGGIDWPCRLGVSSRQKLLGGALLVWQSRGNSGKPSKMDPCMWCNLCGAIYGASRLWGCVYVVQCWASRRDCQSGVTGTSKRHVNLPLWDCLTIGLGSSRCQIAFTSERRIASTYRWACLAIRYRLNRLQPRRARQIPSSSPGTPAGLPKLWALESHS